MKNSELVKLDESELLNLIEPKKRDDFVLFIRELNRREYLVRFQQTETFDSFEHDPADAHHFGWGFKVDGKAVPYFHPNRSFHDEIVWLNKNLFYNPNATFEDRLINSSVVKFYGPSSTLRIAAEGTGTDFIVYERLIKDPDYLLRVCRNIEEAAKNKIQIYGTTELRTSLQVAARNYARKIGGTPIDRIEGTTPQELASRKTRPSDILHWFTHIGPLFVDFYKKKPNMEESFNFLTSIRGIGNYYGYHLSCNLARMPGVGTLVKGENKGKIDEDDDFLIPGVGAMNTVNYFYEHLGHSISVDVGRKLINAIRKDQDNFFGLVGESKKHMSVVSELGYFTNFGCEISCCQYSVYRRLRSERSLASKRAKAPISKEGIEFTVLEECEDMAKKNTKSEDFDIDNAFASLEEPDTVAQVQELPPAITGFATTASIPSQSRASSKKSVKEVYDNLATPKEQIILSTLEKFGAAEHKTIADAVEAQNPGLFVQEGNWKETWAILQKLVKRGAVIKENKVYRRSI